MSNRESPENHGGAGCLRAARLGGRRSRRLAPRVAAAIALALVLAAGPCAAPASTTPVSQTSVTPSTIAVGATGVSYAVRFTTSSTGQLVFPGTITLTAPAGTFTNASFSTVDTTQNRNIGASVLSNDGARVVLRASTSTPTAPGDAIEVTVTNATNSTAGPHTFDISTSSDTTPVTTPPYTLGADTTPPDTTIALPSGPASDSTPTFDFASTESGSTFECRVDSAAFTACSSPHTTAALADGPHTFEVRAIDAAGNVDPTPASRAFTVTTPSPPDTTPPDTTITAGPSGPTGDGTPTFEFSSSEAGSTFQCNIDGGPFFACSSPFTTPPLGNGPHTFEVRAIDRAGNVDASPAGSFGADAARRNFTVQSAPPTPVLAKNVNVEPVKGEVFVSVPSGAARVSASVPGLKGRRFVPLSEARQIPVGSLLDTRRGTVRLTSARDSKGTTQSSEFLSGVFQVLQSRKRSAKGLTELRLKGSSFSACATRSRGKRSSTRAEASRRLSRRTIRRLRGRGRGRFRTRGRYGAATVRGTDWTVFDRCDGTLTKVKRGKVAVLDFRRRKSILVRAGKSYLARAPR
jgi:hypothetical protein